MASDDVIELGSSDEETEPAPNKKKPPPNAMVHIPNRLLGLTIQPSKSASKFNPATLLKGAIGKSVTVTKVAQSNVNPFANPKKVNGKPIKSQPTVKRVQIPIHKSIVKPLPNTVQIRPPIIQRNAINPLNKTGIMVANMNNAKVNSMNKAAVNPLNMAKLMKTNTAPVKFVNTIIKGQPAKNISGLPPGITVKRTTPPNCNPDAKRRKLSPRIVQMSKLGVISTNEVVELDDDEPASSSASPQWYLRPEDQEKAKTSPEKVSEDLKAKQNNPKSSTKEKSPEKCQKQSEKTEEKSPEASEKEKENNKEPDKTNFIEITIGDSPIRPTVHKKGFKVGTELPITIEDSPAKSTADKLVPSQSSDDECAISSKDPNSKKKLVYPQTIQMVETVEIEFEPLSDDTEAQDKTQPTDNTIKNKSVESHQNDKTNKDTEEEPIEQIDKLNDTHQERFKDTQQKNKLAHPKHKNEYEVNKTDENKEKPKRVVEVVEIVEIEESPVKSPEMVTHSTPKKNEQATKPEYKLTQIETVVIDDKEKEEYHPIYQSFINLCFELENSDDMKKIVDKKIKAYYRQVPKEYTESESFTDMVSSKLMAMKAGPEKMYLYIKDVVDELNLQRKLAKSLPAKKPAKNEEQEKFLYGEESEFDSKRQRQIRKLEKTLKKLHRAIQKLEEQEVDFDDEEDSVYILTDSEDNTSSKDDIPIDKEVLLQRYKERMVRVHAKLCQLTNTKMPSESRMQIDARPGQPKGPAKRLEKWINKKVPIGTPMPFPDFHDVLRCVRDANQEDKLGWNEADIMEEARDLFTRCGKKLQRRRQENEWRLAASRIPADEVDPAENNTDLKKKLEDNRRVAAKKETEVFNKYADRQNQLKLEAVEIGDKEAEESPDESDDEETGDDSALTSKEERKERLKRLLQEKSKKTNADKENQPKVDQTVDGGKDTCSKDFSSIKYTDDQNKCTVDNNTSQNKDPVDGKSPPNKVSIENLQEAESSIKDTDEKGETEHKAKRSPEIDVSNNKKDLNKDNAIESDSCKNNKDDNKLDEKVHSLSDDSNKVESDIDELHLLQKLYSENELNTSIMDSTDTGTPIAISDTTNDTSSDEKRNKKSSDVISIENSSYSESEENNGEYSKDTVADNIPCKEAIQETVDTNIEIECFNNGVEKKNKKTNNEEYNQPLEDILLASSDEANDVVAPKNTPTIVTCINLRDDHISIGETVIEESLKRDNDSDKSDKNENTDASSVEGMEIGPSETCDNQNCLEENIVETTSVKSTDEGSITEITSIKSTESNEEGNAAETMSIKSVETIEDVSDTGVKSVESVVEEVSEKSDKNVEDRNISETAGIRSVETLEDESNSDTQGVKSVETLEDECISEILDVKSESGDNANVNDTTSIKTVKTHDDGNIIETGMEYIEAFEDKNTILDTKSVETLVDKTTDTSVRSIESCEKVNANEAESLKSVETLEGNSKTVVKSVDTIGDVTVTENTDSIRNSIDEMDTAENIQTFDASKAIEKTKEDLIPEAMEVDNVEET